MEVSWISLEMRTSQAPVTTHESSTNEDLSSPVYLSDTFLYR